MTVRILVGDALAQLKTLPDESVQMCCTSPPYWRQRDYGIAGQSGLEATPEEYVARMVEVFGEVRRVLKPDGTLWLNIGEKWASGGWRKPPPGYKDKDLIGVPWMVAFALRSEGWTLRQCNVWAKLRSMPESVRDRSTIAHEYVFQLSKSSDYLYNTDAARTPPAPAIETRLAQNVEAQAGSGRANGGAKTNGPMKAVRRKVLLGSQAKLGARRDRQRGHSRRHAGFNDRWDAMDKAEQMAGGANLRSVWWIATAQYREGHYAVMPDALAEICIVAGSRPGDTILDPFAGVGTTGLVADRLGRDAVLIELNPEYAALATRRIRDEAPLLHQEAT